MIYYTLISSNEYLIKLGNLINEFYASYPSFRIDDYNKRISYIINQTEFETNDFYIGFNTDTKNLFLSSDFNHMVETNKSTNKEIVDLYGFFEMIKDSHGIMTAPISETATPKNKERSNLELLIKLRQTAQKLVDDLTIEINKTQN